MRGNDKLLDLYLVHLGRTVQVDKSITNDRIVSKDKKKTRRAPLVWQRDGAQNVWRNQIRLLAEYWRNAISTV